MTAVYSKVLSLINLKGPISCDEIAKALDITVEKARGYVSSHKAMKRVHIGGWERVEKPGRSVCRALYAEGNRRNSPKPPPIRGYETTRRYRERKRKCVNSVFALGMEVNQRRIPTLNRSTDAQVQ